MQNLDRAPAILAVLGVASTEDMQGNSFAPILRGETPRDWRDSIYYHYYGCPSVHQVARHYGIPTDRHKLIWFHQFDEWELYDLDSDPDELVNIHAAPASEILVTDLRSRLETLRVHYEDASASGPMPATCATRCKGVETPDSPAHTWHRTRQCPMSKAQACTSARCHQCARCK